MSQALIIYCISFNKSGIDDIIQHSKITCISTCHEAALKLCQPSYMEGINILDILLVKIPLWLIWLEHWPGITAPQAINPRLMFSFEAWVHHRLKLVKWHYYFLKRLLSSVFTWYEELSTSVCWLITTNFGLILNSS